MVNMLPQNVRRLFRHLDEQTLEMARWMMDEFVKYSKAHPMDPHEASQILEFYVAACEDAGTPVEIPPDFGRLCAAGLRGETGKRGGPPTPFDGPDRSYIVIKTVRFEFERRREADEPYKAIIQDIADTMCVDVKTIEKWLEKSKTYENPKNS